MAKTKFVERWRHGRTSDEAMRAERWYRRRLGLLKLVVPVIAAGMLISLVAWPLMTGGDDGFRVDFADKNFHINGRDEMLDPRFIGTDSTNQPYTVTAEVAMRPEGDAEVIYLMMPKADITLEDGDWMFIEAEQGLYDRVAETLTLEGSVNMFSDKGFEVQTDSIVFDLQGGNASGDQPVKSQGPWGHLNSVGIRYDAKQQVFYFPGRPTLILYPDTMNAEG
jgi:lipopolysaccharide export system protein LptC